MPRTARGVRNDPAARIAELARQRPEWQAWFSLLDEVEMMLTDPAWQAPVDRSEADPSPDPVTGAPLLNRQTLRVDAEAAQRLVRRLASLAAEGDLDGAAALSRYRPPAADAAALIRAAVCQDSARLAALADAAGLERGPLASVAHLAALPLLRSCGRLLADGIPVHWPHGYCPICAAWPILAERRGLDRSRRLRCARCAAEWEAQPLLCVYCGERSHDRLGSLVPDGQGEVLKVETCGSCHGYLKSVATLQAIPPSDLLLRDIETVELDLVALDRGYTRPEQSGFPLEVRIG